MLNLTVPAKRVADEYLKFEGVEGLYEVHPRLFEQPAAKDSPAKTTLNNFQGTPEYTPSSIPVASTVIIFRLIVIFLFLKILQYIFMNRIAKFVYRK